MFIVNLVPHHDPEQAGLIRGGRNGLPMRYGDILHPVQISDVVDVAELVNIGGFDRDGEFEGLRGGLHVSSMRC